jgi:hypothetical protein
MPDEVGEYAAGQFPCRHGALVQVIMVSASAVQVVW